MELLSVLGSSLGGSLLGWIGAAVTRHQEYKQKQKEFEHDLKLTQLNQAHELSMAQFANSAALEKLAAEQQSTIISGEYAGLIESIKADAAITLEKTGNAWLDFAQAVRGLARPTLTGLLLAYSMFTLVYITQKYSITPSEEQLYNLVYLITNCLVTSANTAMAWWFGSRSNMGK